MKARVSLGDCLACAAIPGFRCQRFVIKEFRDSGILVLVNIIDRIPIIPKFLNYKIAAT
jgi:hypothetical protein